jgi:hypothetical protein
MTEANQADRKEATKSPGATFPYLSLPESVKIIRDAGSYGKQHSLSALASYAGHTTANSGPFKQKLASLRQWAFVNTTNGTATLTGAAMGIAYPTSPDETAKILLAAFNGCRIFRKIYDDSAKGVPLRPELVANVAVTTHGVSVIAKDKFLKSFVESAEAVGLLQRMPNGEIKLLQETDAQEKASQSTSTTEPPTTTTGTQSNTTEPTPPELKTFVSQPWQDDKFEIVFEIRSNNPLPVATFTQIGAAVGSIEKVWKVLHGNEAED